MGKKGQAADQVDGQTIDQAVDQTTDQAIDQTDTQADLSAETKLSESGVASEQGDEGDLQGEGNITEIEAGEIETGELEKLEAALVAAGKKADEHWDQLIRSKAEIDNLRRRAERDVENAHKFALESFIGELLPVVDSLELGLSALQQESGDLEKVQEGIELTLKILVDALQKSGVAQLNPEGERFNPEQHQAMTTRPADHVEPNTVLTVFQKGYLLNDRLIRPAMVVVSTGNKAVDDTAGKVDEMA